ncbi:MAG TPA: hypothetical protein VI232_26745, partial [Reyranella sp.]
MRLSKLLVVLIGVAAAGPALAGPPDDPAAATTVTVLRGSSAPLAPYTAPPREVVREVVYLPAYDPPAYDYYLPAYYLALPFGIVRQHRHVATAAATMAH